MAGKTHEVNVKFMADLADFQSQLAAMPDMSAKEAKKAVNALVKQQARLEKATKASTKATLQANRDQFKKFRQETDKAEDSLKKFEDAAGETDTIVSALAGGLGEINPALGSMIAVGAEGASVLEAVARSGSNFARVLGPAVVLIGAGAAAFTYFSAESEKAAEALKEQEERIQGLQDALDNFHSSNQDVLVQNELLKGGLSDLEAEEMKVEQRIRSRGQASREALEAEIAHAKAQEELARQGKQKEMDVKMSREEAFAATQRAEAALKEFNKTEEEYLKKGVENVKILHQRKTALEAKRKKEKESKDAIRAKNKALKEEEAAQKALIEVEQERLRLMDEVDAEIDKIIANEERLSSLKDQLFSTAEALEVLNPMEKIAQEEAAALERFDKMSLEALNLAAEQNHNIKSLDEQLAQERADIEEAYQQKRQDLAAQTQEKEKEINKKRLEDALTLVDTIAQAEIDRRTKTIETLKEEIEDAEGSLTSKQIAELQARLEANQKAAQRAFKAQQAAAVARVTMSTAEAIMATMGQFGFPIGLIPAGLAAAMGGAQIASILSQSPPKFHTGGAVSNQAPDEFDIRVTRPEMVLNPTGAAIIGRDTVAAANSGTLGSQNQTVVVQWRNRVLDVVTADVARRPSPIRSAIKRNRRAGQKR